MSLPAEKSRVVHFGVFEVDLQEEELRKSGIRIKLQEQPLQILITLLERPGQAVTREELRRKLWPTDTFVDFDHSLNSSINKLREALGDNSENPRFIETLHRRGYRFIAPVAPVSQPVDTSSAHSNGDMADAGAGFVRAGLGRRRARWIMGAATGVLVTTGIVLALNVASVRERLMEFAGARHSLPVPKIESIAVLPLENLSGDPEQEYFADGMTDELIATLAKARALRVTSRTSAMQYKKTNKSMPQIGRELNVDAVVEGTVLQSNGRVRITAQLVHAPTDRHLWAESYESEMRDLLVLQGEVARAIAGEIQGKLQPEERARFATASPVKPEAYQAYLKGRLFYYKAYYRLTAEPLLKAINYTQQAIQIDPGYAPAYALLAACYYDSSQSRWGAVPDTEAAQKARATALKALELDNSLADAHVVLGAVHDGVDWDWAGAEREFKRAIELDPNLVRAHVGLAYHLVFVGRSDEAIREINRAVELDPLSWYTFFSQNAILFFTRHYDQAIEQARNWLEIYPDSYLAYLSLARAFEAKGMYDEGVAALQKSMALAGEPADIVAGLGRAYKFGGIRRVWRYDLERLTNKAARGDLSGPYSAQFNSLLGNKDKAIESIEKIYSDPASREMMFDIEMDPRCDNLRSDRRFQDILRRMNIPPQE